MSSSYLLGICDYCQNSNRQKLTRRGEEYLCNRCLEDRRYGATGSAVAKRQKDMKFLDDYKNIVAGVKGE
jgi:hypothetical protein